MTLAMPVHDRGGAVPVVMVAMHVTMPVMMAIVVTMPVVADAHATGSDADVDLREFHRCIGGLRRGC
jgi:hypothetical protein